MIKCMKDGCGTQNPDGSKFCKHCGAPLSVWKTGLTAPAPTSAPVPPAPAAGKGPTAAELQKAKADAARFEAEAAQAKTNEANVRQALARSEQRVLQLEADLAAAPDAQAFARVQADLAAAQAEVTRINAQLQQHGGTATQLAQAQRDLAQARQDLAGARAEVGRLSGLLQTANTRADGAEQQWRAEQADVQRLNGLLTSEKDRGDRAEQQRQNAQAEVRRLSQEEQRLGDRIRNLEAEVARFSTQPDWRNLMAKYFKYGAGAFGGLVMFIITWVVFGFGVVLPLAFLVGQLIVIYRAGAVNVNGPTKVGWVVVSVPMVLLTVGMWLQPNENGLPTGLPYVNWNFMTAIYYPVLLAAVFARAKK